MSLLISKEVPVFAAFAAKPLHAQNYGRQRKIPKVAPIVLDFACILFHRSPQEATSGSRRGSTRANPAASSPRTPSHPSRSTRRAGPPDMAPAAPYGGAEPQRQADLLKQEGNAFFRKERLSAAIDAYTGVSLTDSPLPAARIIGLLRVLRACCPK